MLVIASCISTESAKFKNIRTGKFFLEQFSLVFSSNKKSSVLLSLDSRKKKLFKVCNRGYKEFGIFQTKFFVSEWKKN